MRKLDLFLASVAAVGAMALASPPDAHAVPLDCAHRGIGHVDKHGGQLEDDRFHIARGELPTCKAQDGGEHEDSSDDGDGKLFPHRDRKTHISIRDFF